MLSPRSFPDSIHKVFTVLRQAAVVVVSIAEVERRLLMRQGHIRPGKALSREIADKGGKSAGATAASSYDPSILRRSSQKRWINGEREWATGQPMTHAFGLP